MAAALAAAAHEDVPFKGVHVHRLQRRRATVDRKSAREFQVGLPLVYQPHHAGGAQGHQEHPGLAQLSVIAGEDVVVLVAVDQLDGARVEVEAAHGAVVASRVQLGGVAGTEGHAIDRAGVGPEEVHPVRVRLGV